MDTTELEGATMAPEDRYRWVENAGEFAALWNGLDPAKREAVVQGLSQDVAKALACDLGDHVGLVEQLESLREQGRRDHRAVRRAAFDQGHRMAYNLGGGDLGARMIAAGPDLSELLAEYERVRWSPSASVWAARAEKVLRGLVREISGDHPHPDADVMASVVLERARQDAKWGEPTDRPDGTGGARRVRAAENAKNRTDAHAADGSLTWEHILAEEVAEAFAETDPVALRAELVQVAAVAVKWVRMLDARADHPNMSCHGVEVAVDWSSGLVLHEGDAEWHPWDEAEYGPRPARDHLDGGQ